MEEWGKVWKERERELFQTGRIGGKWNRGGEETSIGRKEQMKKGREETRK